MPPTSDAGALSGLLAAALALSIAPLAQAETAPEAGSIAYKFLSYQDSQPGADRIRVTSPALDIVAPIAGAWSLEASHVVDSISGASPAFHTASLKKLHDRRRATDLSASHYSDNGSQTLGISYSSEADYISRGISTGASFSSEDKNTTWNVGLNLQHDTVNPSNHIVADEHKNVIDLSLGLTRVFTVRDLAQIVLGHSRGRGYFSDPYKIYDKRPRERDHNTLLLRWNHHVDAWGGTSHLSYRYYSDSFGIRAHTVTAEFVQPLGHGWTVSPLLRMYSQSAASFYVELDPAAAPFPTNPPEGALYSTEEQRLSAYGARTIGLKLGKQLDLNWHADLKVEQYDQRSSWRLGGSGSVYLAPFAARTWQLGVARSF